MIHRKRGFPSRTAFWRAAGRSVSHGTSVHFSLGGNTPAWSFDHCSAGSEAVSNEGTGVPFRSAASLSGGAADLNGTPVPQFETSTLPAEQWSKLHAGVFPPKEKWTEIQWETDLAAARKRAAREGKPLFMWLMDGHPLGCT